MASKSRPSRRPAAEHATAADLDLEALAVLWQPGSVLVRPFRYLELVDGAGVGGEAGVEHVGTVPCGGAAHGAGQDGPAASAGQNGAPAGAGQASLGADQDAVEKTSNSTTP